MSTATDQRLAVLDMMHDAERELCDTKGREYAGTTDVLGNFRRNAERLNLTMEQVWAVYFSKHVDSILSHCANPTAAMSEPIAGRILDARVYLGLLQLIVDERATA